MTRTDRSSQKKEQVLEPLKLSFLVGAEPVRPTMLGIPCARCGRDDMPLSSGADIGRSRLLCDACAVDEFREAEGFESREAAASARARAADTPLLFAEIVLSARAEELRLPSPRELPLRERARLVADAHFTYVTALSRAERREVESLIDQSIIERRLRELLKFIGQPSAAADVAISLTRADYERLLVLSYLGNYVINGLFKERVGAYDDVVSKIFSRARDAGLGRYVDTASGASVPSRELADHPDVRRFRREYDEEIFWDELVRRLAERDMRADKGAAAIARLSAKQYDELIVLYEAPYLEEFDRHGLKRVVIDDDMAEAEEGERPSGY